MEQGAPVLRQELSVPRCSVLETLRSGTGPVSHGAGPMDWALMILFPVS